MIDLRNMRPESVRELAGYLERALTETGNAQITLRQAGYDTLADALDATSTTLNTARLSVKAVQAVLVYGGQLPANHRPY